MHAHMSSTIIMYQYQLPQLSLYKLDIFVDTAMQTLSLHTILSNLGCDNSHLYQLSYQRISNLNLRISIIYTYLQVLKSIIKRGKYSDMFITCSFRAQTIKHGCIICLSHDHEPNNYHIISFHFYYM